MMAMHPHPIPCRGCGFILQATYAEQNLFLCPNCGAAVCYICGCTERNACVVEIHNGDKTSKTEWICEWSSVEGTCSHCYARAAYDLYQDANDMPADDPFYLSIGRSAFGVKGWYVMLLIFGLVVWLLHFGTHCLTFTLDEEPYYSVTLHSVFCNGHLGGSH